MRPSFLFFLGLSSVISLSLAPALKAQGTGMGAGVTQGTFTDASGAQHAWRVQESHALTWDDKPYIPVGMTFVAQSLSARPTDVDLQKDKESLQRLRARGITDLCLKPSIGISRVSPEAFQKLIDYLEAEGFSYGISLNDAPREPLLGYYIRPSSSLRDVPNNETQMVYPARGILSSFYFSFLASSGEIMDRGEATIRNNALVAPLTDTTSLASVASSQDKRLLFLIPERVYMPSESPGLPNLWEGFEGYRDSLLAFFNHVKLGKGFRFFLDPLAPRLGLTDEMKQVIPSSTTLAVLG